MTELFSPSDRFEVAYPFILEPFTSQDEEGWHETLSWRPGCRFIDCGPDDSEAVADGVGKQIITVVSTHQPSPRYPMRVFYTQQWLAPGDRRPPFGKDKLRVKTLQFFRLMIKGYRFHYRLSTPAEREAIKPERTGL